MKKYKVVNLEHSAARVSIRPGIWGRLKKDKRIIHVVLIATKPDIIKQAPLILELEKEGESVLVVHSGQHYDVNLSGGMEEEFNIMPDINLNVRGTLYEQQSQIIFRLGYILSKLKNMGKLVIPYIYGDTTTAVAAGVSSFANLIGTAHVEAGLRTMTPPREIFEELLNNRYSIMDYYNDLQQNSNWVKGSYEPYPEQFDTRASAPSAGIHFAPTYLNAANLLNEGFSGDTVFLVGNPVSDALKIVEENINKSSIFQKYPILAEGDVIRFCIHRRENVSSYHRFKSIFDSLSYFVKEGRTVLLISLGATENALKAYGLKKEIIKLAKKYKNFVYSPVWPYYTDVIAVMKRCKAVVTDSGSIQEETNLLNIPGIVLRFNSDRPEAVFSGANLLAPPVKSEVIIRIIDEVLKNEELRNRMMSVKNLYGENVSKKIVNIIKKVTKEHTLFELLEHERLGFSKKSFWEKGGTKW